MAHDQQQNTDSGQNGRLHADSDRSILIKCMVCWCCLYFFGGCFDHCQLKTVLDIDSPGNI